MSATSSQRSNLRPISRSTPTSSNPQRGVQRPRGLAGGLDAGEHGVEAATARRCRAARSTSSRPMPSAVAVAAHVDRVLDAGAVRGALLVRRQRAEPDHRRRLAASPSGSTATIAANAPAARRQPLLLVCQRARHQVERGRGVQHLVVVDRADRLGVGRAWRAGCVIVAHRAARVAARLARPGATARCGPGAEWRDSPWSVARRAPLCMARRSAAPPRAKALLAQ